MLCFTSPSPGCTSRKYAHGQTSAQALAMLCTHWRRQWALNVPMYMYVLRCAALFRVALALFHRAAPLIVAARGNTPAVFRILQRDICDVHDCDELLQVPVCVHFTSYHCTLYVNNGSVITLRMHVSTRVHMQVDSYTIKHAHTHILLLLTPCLTVRSSTNRKLHCHSWRSLNRPWAVKSRCRGQNCPRLCWTR